MMRWVPGLFCLATGAMACGSSESRPAAAVTTAVHVPERSRTAGDDLMAFAPAGADLVVEIDLARLRQNPVMGPLLCALATPPGDSADAGEPGIPGDAGQPRMPGAPDLDHELLARTDAVLLAAYHVGGERAATLTLLRGDAPVGERVAERVHALGPPELLARLGERAGATLAEDHALLAVRAHAMPERATGAFLRAAARLDFDARVALATRLDLDSVPGAVSVWADVADDLAVVATLAAEPGQGAGQARMLAALRDRLAAISWVRRRYLHFTLHGLEISSTDARARAVLVIGPSRLQRMIARFVGALPAGPRAPGACPNPAAAPAS